MVWNGDEPFLLGKNIIFQKIMPSCCHSPKCIVPYHNLIVGRLSKTLLLAGDDVGTCAHQEIKVNNFVSTQLKTKPFLLTTMCKACLIEFSRRTFLRELSWNAARSHWLALTRMSPPGQNSPDRRIHSIHLSSIRAINAFAMILIHSHGFKKWMLMFFSRWNPPNMLLDKALRLIFEILAATLAHRHGRCPTTEFPSNDT